MSIPAFKSGLSYLRQATPPLPDSIYKYLDYIIQGLRLTKIII